MEIANSIDRLIANLEIRLMEEGLARTGEIIVIICGAPLDIKGRTNLMKIHRVGDVTRLDESMSGAAPSAN
jgi:pyruvate kinase